MEYAPIGAILNVGGTKNAGGRVARYSMLNACYLFSVLLTHVQGKLEDRKPLMVLFDDVAMHYILSAAQ